MSYSENPYDPERGDAANDSGWLSPEKVKERLARFDARDAKRAPNPEASQVTEPHSQAVHSRVPLWRRLLPRR